MIALMTLLFVGALKLQVSQSYPIIFETSANDRQCIDLNIPDKDDAHLFFLPLNDDIADEVEDWYVTQLAEVTRHDSTQFLKNIDPPPPNVLSASKNIVKSKLSVTVNQIDASPPSSNSETLSYFKLTKMLSIAAQLSRSKGWDRSKGMFKICISVRGKKDVRVLFDALKISEFEEKLNKRHIVKKEHLTPLEEAFDEGISLAHGVIDEMRYMEKRENRMKQTADGTNTRIRYFSYLSIFVLLGVTWIQINYLKSYFKKKKVL